MRCLFFVLSLWCMSLAATADPLAAKTSLRGTVTDAVDGQPVVGASIYLPLLKQGTVTDAEGRYVLNNLPMVRTTVQVSYLGHQTIIQTVDLRQTQHFDFQLRENNAMLGEVVVTGLTGEALANRSPSPVTVVSPAQLQGEAATNIIDAIARQPGVSQLTTGSGISKPVIRGLGFNRIVVVNDAIRQEGQQWGDEHGIEIDAQAIHSVEILKGPASLMYGSDAMAGVLVMHQSPVMPQGTMQATVGGEYQSNANLYAYTANFSGNRSGLVWNWRWSEKDAGEYQNKVDGRVPGSQFHERALSGLLGVNRVWGYSHLKLSGYYLKPGLVEGERDAQTGELEPSEAFQKIGHYKAVLDNSFLMGDGQLKAIVGYQQNRRREFEPGEEPDEGVEPGLDFRLHTVNYDVHYQSPDVSGWKYAAGVSGMWQRSENLGEEYLIPAYRLFDAGLFASATRSFRRLTLSGGMRYDRRWLHAYALEDEGEQRFSDFRRGFSGLTGSLGAILNLTDRMNLRVNLSRGFRAPNLSELGSNGEHEGTFRYEVGNAQLNPESSWQADLGIDFSSEIISAQVSLFANDIQDYIFLERTTANGYGSAVDHAAGEAHPRYSYTQGHARLWGGELLLDIHPVEPLHFENTFSLVNAVQLHQPRASHYLPFTPAPRWTSDLRYDIVRDGRRYLNNAYAALRMSCYLRQDHYRQVYDTETYTPSYTLFGFSVGTDILSAHGRRLCTVTLTGSNLFDRAYQSHLSRLKYAESPGISNPGRNICVKVVLPISL